MSLNTLHDLLIAEVKDLYSAETQLVRALPKMAKGASNERLRSAFESHLEETREHVARLEKVASLLGGTARGKKCKGMEGLIAEGSEMLDEDGDEVVIDAGLISAADRVEHYEIAGYSGALAMAQQMGHTQVAELLEQTLSEERAASEELRTLAVDDVHASAPQMDGMTDDDEVEEVGAAPRKASTRGPTVRRRNA
jgi:ferritin-like metal-binding protein YciE